MDYWNNLIKIKDNHPDPYRRKWADAMLGCLNTAGGKHILKRTGELNEEEIAHYLKECVNTKEVFVVGYESDLETEAVSFFDWYDSIELSRKKIGELNSKKNDGTLKGEIYSGKVIIPNDQMGTITEYVENFLQLNDWENSFK